MSIFRKFILVISLLCFNGLFRIYFFASLLVRHFYAIIPGVLCVSNLQVVITQHFFCFNSEAEIEGNPRTTGKVRVNFKFNGDYSKLQKLIKSGNINGLLVVKNSLEGPMLNLEESK